MKQPMNTDIWRKWSIHADSHMKDAARMALRDSLVTLVDKEIAKRPFPMNTKQKRAYARFNHHINSMFLSTAAHAANQLGVPGQDLDAVALLLMDS